MRYYDIVNACVDIGLWQKRTFGERDLTRGTVNKLKTEAEELALALFTNDYVPDEAGKVRDEIADVGILLFGLAAHLGVDLGAAMADKMDRNRERKWGERQGDGSFQHVE